MRYQLNGGSLKTATGTTSWEFKITLKDGKNKIRIFAVDSVGNESKSKKFTVELD